MLSKIYEKILYAQIYEYFDNIFSKYLCGFRKGHSIQHCLLYMLERLIQVIHKGLCMGILLTDLSKAFDCIHHDLLIAKLNAYGFSNNSLVLINDYLSNGKQWTKIGACYSTWHNILYGVPQGSILGPLLFNIYINDLLLFSQNFTMADYADDCSPYEFSGSIGDVIQKIDSRLTTHDSRILIECYKTNYLKPNPDKWHLLLSEMGSLLTIMIGNECIPNSSNEKILGVFFDNNLNFNTHITKLCKKSRSKAARIS